MLFAERVLIKGLLGGVCDNYILRLAIIINLILLWTNII